MKLNITTGNSENESALRASEVPKKGEKALHDQGIFEKPIVHSEEAKGELQESSRQKRNIKIRLR